MAITILLAGFAVIGSVDANLETPCTEDNYGHNLCYVLNLKTNCVEDASGHQICYEIVKKQNCLEDNSGHGICTNLTKKQNCGEDSSGHGICISMGWQVSGISGSDNSLSLPQSFEVTDLSIDIGRNGVDWSYPGTLKTRETVDAIGAAILAYMNNCYDEYCNVPVVFNTSSHSKLLVDNITIQATYCEGEI